MANSIMRCRAGAGTDKNPFALVHYPDFGDWSWGEAAPQQVVWLWVPSHPPSAALAAAARPGCWTEGALPCSPVAASVFPGPVRHSKGLSEAGTDCL